MTETPHDYEQQRRDTYAAFADIQSESDLPETGDLELAFLAGDAADVGGHLVCAFDIHVEDAHLCAFGGQRPRCCLAKARCASCDDGCESVVDFHAWLLADGRHRCGAV